MTYSTYSIENNLYCSWWEMCGTQQDMDGQAQAMKKQKQELPCLLREWRKEKKIFFKTCKRKAGVQPGERFERYHTLQEHKL